MKKYIEELRYCKTCNKNTLHHGNVKRINWLMHIALMLLFGVGVITLIFALLTTPLGSQKLVCKVCERSN